MAYLTSGKRLVEAFIEAEGDVMKIIPKDLALLASVNKMGVVTRMNIKTGAGDLCYINQADAVRLTYFQKNKDIKYAPKSATLYTAFGPREIKGLAETMPFDGYTEATYKQIVEVIAADYEENRGHYSFWAYFIMQYIIRPALMIGAVKSLMGLFPDQFETGFDPTRYKYAFKKLPKFTNAKDLITAKNVADAVTRMDGVFIRSTSLGKSKAKIDAAIGIAIADYRSADKLSEYSKTVLVDMTHMKTDPPKHIAGKKMTNVIELFKDWADWNGKNENYACSKGAVYAIFVYGLEIVLGPAYNIRLTLKEMYPLTTGLKFYSDAKRGRTINEALEDASDAPDAAPERDASDDDEEFDEERDEEEDEEDDGEPEEAQTPPPKTQSRSGASPQSAARTTASPQSAARITASPQSTARTTGSPRNKPRHDSDGEEV